MIDDPRLVSAVVGAISGAIVSAGIALHIGRRNREGSYYSGLVKLIGDHNWNVLKDALYQNLYKPQQGCGC